MSTLLYAHHLNYSHLQGSIRVEPSSKMMMPVSPQASHVCAYIADSIYSPALMLCMFAENLVFLPSSLSFSDAMRWSIALISVAMLSMLSSREPCQIEYVIVIYCSSFCSLFIVIILVGIGVKVKPLACGVGHTTSHRHACGRLLPEQVALV